MKQNHKWLYYFVWLIAIMTMITGCKEQKEEKVQDVQLSEEELYRPNFHFTPAASWMNDPNGMFYLDGTYHLFFQYYPDDNVWGPMHWGHATSEDMIDWEEQPIALYPDSLGYIFSGGAVVDVENTSGLGSEDQPPVIAMFTYHDPEGEKSDAIDFQYQGIAYSLDQGATWTKYDDNPVIPNPGIRDFRDPKVIWDAERSQWVMVLAAQDKAMFYGSSNMKEWELLSEFGKDVGAHGGVWECPDFFPMQVDGSQETRWVLLQSLNPGSANGGSGTQYFVGDFDGKSFTLDPEFVTQLETEGPQWLDFGRDNYAGVTWSNIPVQDGRKLFIGWMSNWDYAQVVPTETWRSAMTLPRELKLKRIGDAYKIFSQVATEIENYIRVVKETASIVLDNASPEVITTSEEVDMARLAIRFELPAMESGIVSWELKNSEGEKLRMGYNADESHFFVDRSESGKVGFSEKFAAKSSIASYVNPGGSTVELYLDKTSVELFVNGGAVVMTEIFFPSKPYSELSMNSNVAVTIENVLVSEIKTP